MYYGVPMLIVLSTSKTLNTACYLGERWTLPRHLDSSAKLAKMISSLSFVQLQNTMSLSDKLTELNYKRYQEWSSDHLPENSQPAIFTYSGEVYEGLNIQSIPEKNYAWLQKHVRLLSGLYGVLRPLDRIQPYRLEMKTQFRQEPNELYSFWEKLVRDDINEDLVDIASDIIINLASEEYSRVTRLVRAKIIQPIFQDWSKGSYKVISFYAKKARGMMVNYAAIKQITNHLDLLSFNIGGYNFCPDKSDDTRWIFRRRIK